MDCADSTKHWRATSITLKIILCAGDVEIKNYGKTFHITSTDRELGKAIDFILPVHLLKTLYMNIIKLL